MGSGGSKQSKASEVNNTKGEKWRRAESPKEKHNSADSKAPLAEHAVNFACPRISSLKRHRSIASEIAAHHAHSNSITSDGSIQPASRTSSITSPPPREAQPSIKIDNVEGHSNVTRPPPPPRLRHLSELIDPAELPMDCHIRSPSGTLLALEQFLVHPDRPRSIRERQEEIKEKVRAASRLGVETEKSEVGTPKKSEKAPGVGDRVEEKKKRRCCGWWCFTSS